MNTFHRSVFVLLLCSTTCVWGQGPYGQPDGSDESPSRPPLSSNASTPQPRGDSSAQRNGGTTGRPDVPQRDGLEVERGRIPELFSRDQSGMNGQQGAQSGQGNRGQGKSQRGGQSGKSGGQREFIQNALWFDANSDRQLAANELANLFHALATSQYRKSDRGQNTQAGPTTTQTTQTTQSTTTGGNAASTGNQVDSTLIQRQSVQQALMLFLQLALQFDANGDGLLSQPELYALANALLNNDMGLLNAATQPTRRSSGRATSTTTTTTTTQRARPNGTQRDSRARGRDSGRQNGDRRRTDSQREPSDRPEPDRPRNESPRQSSDGARGNVDSAQRR